MKVLYIISTFEKGIGGHYFSLQSTIESLYPEIEPTVVNIGRVESPIINNMDVPTYQFLYKYANFKNIQKRILKIIQEHQIERIHCFDDRAYLFIRNHKFKGIPVAITKCGGPNPKYFPRVSNLILFSKENLNSIQGKKGYKNIYLVPNRSLPFNPSKIKVSKLRKQLNLGNDSLVFLRIARISHFYFKSLQQSIDLVKNIDGAQLIIIGQTIDGEVLSKLKDLANEKIHIVNDEFYYKNAKDIIPICDFYIGTGRGIMEATSLKKIVLTPVVDRKFPALINKKSFPGFFNTNFSERNVSSLSNYKLLEEVKEAVNSYEKRKELSDFSHEIYNQEFNISSKKDWYLDFYQNLSLSSDMNIIDRLKHFLFFHYYYISQA